MINTEGYQHKVTPIKNLILLIFCLFLASCASVPQGGSRVNFKPPTDLSSWTAKGSISLTTASESTQAKFVWEQEKNNYTIDFFGPLGTYHHQLQGRKGQVVLTNYEGKQVQAPTAQALLRETVGWNLPVENLHDWIRGIKKSAPHWSVDYRDYTQVGGYTLPSTLLLSYPGLKIKIKITKWDVT